MNKYLSKLTIAFCLVLGVVVAQPTHAQIPTTAETTSLSNWTMSIVPLDCQDKNGCDICEVTKVFTNAASIIAALLSALALLMFVLGGLFWIFSAGNEQRVETGKKILIGTVTGLAIVFLAWLAVNVVVRMASLSGGTSTNTVFSKNWWELKGCYPAVLTTCKGHNIGEACGGGTGFECGAGTTDGAKCACYRYVDPVLGGIKCEGDDATALTSVNKGTKNDKNSCACLTGCSILKAQTGDAYACIADATLRAGIKDTSISIQSACTTNNYSCRTDASCATTGYTCALKTK